MKAGGWCYDAFMEETEVLMLRDHVTHASFQAFAKSMGWRLVKAGTGDAKTSAFEEIWSDAGGGAHINYLDDPGPERRFLVVRGTRPYIGNVGYALGGGLGVRTIYEILNQAEAARTDAAKIRSAMDLVVAFYTENSDALKQLRRYYKRGSETVRRMVVAALAYRFWPGGITLLDEIAESDPDDFIRQQAEKTARQWREHTSAHASI